jgi:WD40 repeat protein
VSGDGTTYFYDATTGGRISQWRLPGDLMPADLVFWPGSHYAVAAAFQSLYFFDPEKGEYLATISGASILGNLHFTPDKSGVLVSEGRSARVIPLVDPSFDLSSAQQEVARLDRWKLTADGALVPR